MSYYILGWCSSPNSLQVCWQESWNFFVLLFGLSWIRYYFFQVGTPSHTAVFSFGTIFKYSRHVCLCAIWKTYSDPIVCSCFVTEPACYSSSGHVLFEQDHHLCQWPCTVIAGFTILFRVTCWGFIILPLIYFFLFTLFFSLCIKSRGISVTTESGLLAVSSSWWSYCYWCYAQS